MRLIDPTEGSILFEGKEITHLSQEQLRPIRQKMQVVFQNPAQALNQRKTIFEALSEVLLFHERCKTIDECRKKCCTLLDEVGLHESMLYRYPHELSIGQQQRVALARAVSVEPALIVLDECVSALDVSVQAQVLNLLLELHERHGVSYVFISHDLSVVEHLSDRVLVMKDGVVVESGLTQQVFENPQHPYTKELIQASF